MCGSPGLANLSPPPEVRTPTDCREREPRASGPSRRHPRQRGLLLEEMWLGVRGGRVVADWGEPYGGVRGGAEPCPERAGDALARLRGAGAGAAPDARLTGVRGGKGACSCVARLLFLAGRPASGHPFLTPALPESRFSPRRYGSS